MSAAAEIAKAQGQPLDSRDVERILGLKDGASRSRVRRAALWGAAAAILLGGGYALWSSNGSQAAVQYTTQPATRGSLTVIVTATGSAQPITQVNVSSELSGTIRKVFADYNTPVTRGQPLAELDADKLRATIESVRAKLEAVKARVADAAATIEEKRSEFDRKKELAGNRIASVQDLDQAKAAFNRALAGHASVLAEVNVAEAELRLNEINLAKACICSPIDGVVLKRSVDPGQIVASSLQAPILFVIAQDLKAMELQVDIDEADVGKVRIGQKAAFSVDAYPDRKFPAEIRDVRFGSETVQGVVTYKAILTIDNSELLIRPGMTATAEIVVERVADALLVPNPALRFSPPAQSSKKSGSLLDIFLPRLPSASYRPAGRTAETGASRTVWILKDKDNVPAPVAVTIGATDGRRTEIVKGDIAPEMRVIVDSVTPKR